MTPRKRAEQIQIDYRRQILNGDSPDLTTMVEEAIKDFQVQENTFPACTVHTKYKGKRKPRSGCEDCWRAYLWRK